MPQSIHWPSRIEPRVSCRRRLDDDVAALARELLEPVLLDLALRVEPELALDADLDPEPLAVEAVLVALVEAAQRLVALEDVLQRAAPGGVDGERHLFAVTGPSTNDQLRPAAVPLAQLLERAARAPRRSSISSSSVG